MANKRRRPLNVAVRTAVSTLALETVLLTVPAQPNAVQIGQRQRRWYYQAEGHGGMMHPYNWWLVTAATLTALASVAHLCCIMGGAAWYRFFGAGERMARMVEQGSAKPAVITLAIAGILALWSVYALSGAGVITRLPLLYPALIVITAVYLLRAAALPLMIRLLLDRSTRFLVWSSGIVFVIGLVHAIGLYAGRGYLAG